MICFCTPTVTPVVLATCWLALKDNEGVTMEEGGLDRVRRELAVTAQRGFSISFIWAGFQEEDVTY